MNIVKRVADGLRVDPEGVLRKLGVKYTRDGQAGIMGDLWGKEGKSARVEFQGEKRGMVYDFAAGEGCDMLTLWKNIRGLTLPEAIGEAKQFLGIEERESEWGKKKYSKFSDKSKQKLAPLLPDNSDIVSGWLRSRGIENGTIRKFGIEAIDTGHGWAAVFPHKDLKGELVNCSYRMIEEKKIWQEKGCAPTLFGWHTIGQKEFDGGNLLICEGHIDALTWWQAGVPVLSLPAGSGMTWIEQDWDLLDLFENIYLSMDEDEAGEKHMGEIVRRLGSWRCLKVKLPRKDANDVWRECPDPKQVLIGAMFEAKPLKPEKVVSLYDIRQEIDEVITPRQKLERVVKHRHLTVSDGGLLFRFGSVSVWTGYPGAGKTTLLSWVASMDVMRGEKVFLASLEMKGEVTAATFVKQLTGEERPDGPRIEEALGQIKDSAFLFREMGGSDCWELLDAMEYCCHRYGCTVFIIDNLMMIKSKSMDERFEWQVKWLSKLIEFSRRNEVHTHLVAHPRKVDEEEPPKMFDILGASQIAGLVDNVVAVHRRFGRDGGLKQGSVEVYSRKNRDDGWTGKLRLNFDKGTQRFSLYTLQTEVSELHKDNERRRTPDRGNQADSRRGESIEGSAENDRTEPGEDAGAIRRPEQGEFLEEAD